MLKNLSYTARNASGDAARQGEFGILTSMHEAVWDALHSIPGDSFANAIKRYDFATVYGVSDPEPIVKGIVPAIASARRAWADYKALGETAAAGLFKRTDRNFFSAGFSKPGPAEIDQLANLFVSSEKTTVSPAFVKQLEGLVGRDNRLAVARVVLYKAAAPEEGVAKISQVSFPERLVWPKLEAKFGNMPIAVFDANKMRKNLGLSNPEGLLGPGPSKTNRQTLEALLEGSNVSVDRLDGFLKVVGKIQSSPTGDPATFLTRRIILGGGLVAGAAIGTQFADPGSILAPISLGTFIVSGRAFSRLLSSPKGLALLR